VKPKRKKGVAEGKQDQNEEDNEEDEETEEQPVKIQPETKTPENPNPLKQTLPPPAVQTTTQQQPPQPQTDENDPAKRLKNLYKKLRQIEELKAQQLQGKVLDSAQLQKIQSEQQVSAEIAALEKTMNKK